MEGFMDRARIHEGIRRMRFTDILGRNERSELSQVEAAELLGISERTFRRWRDRHRERGFDGLDDRRLAPSPRRAPVAEIERMLGLYRDLYRGFTATSAISTVCRINPGRGSSACRGILGL